jgi:DNA-binding protein Fis
MSQHDFTPRLIAALEAVPLSPAQIERVLPALNKDVAFLDELTEDSTFWDFADKITHAAKLLGIDKKTYIEKAALKLPSLFSQSPETIDANITRAAALLGIDKKTYIEKAALKLPSLFSQSPETIDANITQATARLGIDKKTYIDKAALKRPSLFSQSPETIDANITRAAALLGIDRQTYIEKAALKQPQLFYQSPETIKRNFDYVRDAHAKGYIRSEDIRGSIFSFPTSLSCAPANIHLRSVHAHVRGRDFTLASFFTGAGRTKKQPLRQRTRAPV